MLRRMFPWVSAAVLTGVLAVAAWADATGKWTWTVNFNGQERMQTIELKQEGEKLTGFMIGRNDQKIEIKEGKAKGDEISFIVVRERNGQEFKSTYKGKISGDKLEGTIVSVRDGQERSRDWKAQRQK